MAQGFTPEFLEELKYKCDIVEIISQYVPLQRKGGRFFGCCPFHTEKTPSFCVDQNNGFYHCFGCGASGDVIKFIMEQESMSFFDTVKYLAEKVGMPLPEIKIDPHYNEKKERSVLLKQLMRDAAGYYYKNLIDPKKGGEAREYLKGRGLDESVWLRYGMGLSLDYDSMPSYLRRKGYSVKDLLDCGLISNPDRPSDAFANRIIVPIINSMGEVVAFGGRIYHGEKDVAKYKNSTNTVLFDKGRTIYGVNNIKRDRRKGAEPLTSLILVEGYMDVISLGAAGIRNAVAGMGTALTDGQAHELKRLVPKVYVCYDGDGAGRKATVKNIDTLDKCGLDIRVVSLPDGMDPDETVRQFGSDGFMNYLKDALPVIEYKLKLCKDAYELESVDGRAKYVQAAIRVLSGVESAAQREVYLAEVAKLSRISVETLQNEIERNVRGVKAPENSRQPEKTQPKIADKGNKNLRAARFVLSRIMLNAQYADLSLLKPEWFEDETHRRIFEYAERQPKGGFNVGQMYSEIEGGEVSAILDINLQFANNAKEEEYYTDCAITIANDALKKCTDALNERYSLEKDADARRKIFIEIAETNKKLKSKSLEDKL